MTLFFLFFNKATYNLNKNIIILFKVYLIICHGMGIGDWGLGPIPNPQSPIPNPQ
jgi:hypothetical protein